MHLFQPRFCIFGEKASQESSCAEDPCKFGAAKEEAAETLYCTHSIWKADKRTDRRREGQTSDEKKNSRGKEEGGREEGKAWKEF